ncbi:alpha/beta hydrolase [Streptomyces sp. P38-E01]|uniref:Alpha/beta hydrolase n=1 Tax=Streptomyces tardus TaxID=2780544 RepID=A0A949N7Y3_9ACTN|nr:alpha/beta hydrolase [Streptomyces tardus]MBU7597951.1 alpha/beta hydrolase [Streptomyces tardus]
MKALYRTADSQAEIRSWCIDRLGSSELRHRRSEISTAAGSTSVVTAGPPARATEPTVVLLPGTNMNTATSLPFVGALAARRHTVALDVPGQPGLSCGQRPATGRMNWYASWLDEALRRSVSGPVVVVGHSLGGAIALACASPQITGRVLLSTAGLARLRLPPAVLAATVPWLVRPSVPHAARLLERLVAPGREPSPELVRWMDGVSRHSRTTLAPAPLAPGLLARRRAVPSLVATGQHDVFLPPRVLGPAARRHLGSELHVVETAGHLLPEEEPEQVATLVEEFATGL